MICFNYYQLFNKHYYPLFCPLLLIHTILNTFNFRTVFNSINTIRTEVAQIDNPARKVA